MDVKGRLKAAFSGRSALITGGASFIGSHLAEELVRVTEAEQRSRRQRTIASRFLDGLFVQLDRVFQIAFDLLFRLRLLQERIRLAIVRVHQREGYKQHG